MDELYFIGMDISQEVRKLVTHVVSKITTGMNVNEIKAYNLGVENTISALNAILKNSAENEFVVNIDGIETPTEFDSDDLMWRLSDMLEN
jgi:7-cyano-7-deazaguanine synthase in queuosine biosynthesis